MFPFRLFKLPKTKQFNYIPRYYDPEKEEREKRLAEIRQVRGIADDDKSSYIPNIKGQMRGYLYQRERKQSRNSNVRIAIIIAILLFIVYYLLHSAHVI